MANIVDEPWFIGVMAGVGAFVLILIAVIVILCCYWIRLMKKEDKQHEVSPNDQELGHTNWTLVAAPPTTNTARVIRGDDPSKAGSSLVYMNKEMRANSVSMGTQTPVPGQTAMEQSMGGYRYMETSSYTRNGSVSQMSDASSGSSSKFVRSEMRGSYQNPRITNLSVSSSPKRDENAYQPINQNAASSTSTVVTSQSVKTKENTYQTLNHDTAGAANGVVGSTYSFRIPSEDYNSGGMVMYTAEETRAYSRKVSTSSTVKEMATSYERKDSVSSPSTKSARSELDNEIKELKDTERTAVIKRRISERQNSSENLYPKRATSSYIEKRIEEGDEGGGVVSIERLSSWSASGGQKTIDSRVNRIKKVGAVSVFPN